MEENKRLNELVRRRATKAETISTGSLADSALNTANVNMMSANEGPMDRLESMNIAAAAVSFEPASHSQMLEDKKLAGAAFEDVRWNFMNF